MTTAVRPDARSAASRRSAAGRRARRLRHQRRPGQGDDLPLAVPPGAAWPAELPDRGSGGRRLDRGRPARSRPQGDRGLRRVAGRGGVRALRRPAVVPQRRLWRSGHVRTAHEGDQRGTQPRLLPRDPTVAVRHGHQGPGGCGPDQGRARGGGEALRPRPRLRPGARGGGPRVHRRVPALPDRPFPREDGPGGDHLPAIREHGPGAAVEPQLPVVGADHDGGGLRRGGPGPFLRSRGSGAGRGGEPPDAGGGRGRHGAPLLGGRDGPEGRPGGRVPGHARGRPEAVRARAVRGLPRDRRSGRRLDHRDLRGHKARDRQLALVGSPVLHPHGQAPARAADGAAARLQGTAAPGLPPRGLRAPGARTSS